MSINPLNGSPLPGLGSLSRTDTSKTPTDRAQGNTPNGIPSHGADRAAATLARVPLKPQAPIAGQGAAQSVVPPEPPPGTDPSLWSVLTTEERNFFAKTAAMGPLTYGRIKAEANAAPPSARGVRLDVRA
jgi:hypothetical protein